MADNNELLTTGEESEYLKVSERTVYGWAQDGLIPAYKVAGSWRFRRRDIDQWLESNRTGPQVGQANIEYRILSSPPIGPGQQTINDKMEYENLTSDCMQRIEWEIDDPGRPDGILRVLLASEFKEDILDEAIRRLNRQKKIRTKKDKSTAQMIITRR